MTNKELVDKLGKINYIDSFYEMEERKYNDTIDYINVVVKYKDGDVNIATFKDWEDLRKKNIGIQSLFKKARDLKFQIIKEENKDEQ